MTYWFTRKKDWKFICCFGNNMCFCGNFKKVKIMATITLEYDVRNKQARQMIDIIQSLGLARRKKTGLEEALEDVVNGRLMTIHTPKNRKVK